jgi:hypothetical protein
MSNKNYILTSTNNSPEITITLQNITNHNQNHSKKTQKNKDDFYYLVNGRPPQLFENIRQNLRRSIVRKEDAATFSNKKYIFQVSK